MRVYAGNLKAGIIEDSGNTHFVGFSLHNISVLAKDVRSGSDFSFYVAYVMSTIVLYVICVTTVHFLVSKSDKSRIEAFTNEHAEVLKGLTIVISVFIVLELLTEFVMAVVWTAAVKDPLVAFTVFLAALIYYSPGAFSICQIVYYCLFLKKDALFGSFVWVGSYFAYILLYSFFPAFVLAFAYPIMIITIFVFVATFMILSTVYLITYLKRDEDDGHAKQTNVSFGCINCVKSNDFCTKHRGYIKFSIGCVFTVALSYFFLFVFALLYSLVIGRASVVNSAPLAILSLLPSLLISTAAWVMKTTIFENIPNGNNANENDANQNNADENVANKNNNKIDRGTSEGDEGMEMQPPDGIRNTDDQPLLCETNT